MEWLTHLTILYFSSISLRWYCHLSAISSTFLLNHSILPPSLPSFLPSLSCFLISTWSSLLSVFLHYLISFNNLLISLLPFFLPFFLPSSYLLLYHIRCRDSSQSCEGAGWIRGHGQTAQSRSCPTEGEIYWWVSTCVHIWRSTIDPWTLPVFVNWFLLAVEEEIRR